MKLFLSVLISATGIFSSSILKSLVTHLATPTYIKKIRVREPGEVSTLLKNFKNASFFCDVYAFFKIVNSVAAGYHPLTHV